MAQHQGVFSAVSESVTALAGILTSTARTAEKTVHLVEKEVDNLHTIQDARILETKLELEALVK